VEAALGGVHGRVVAALTRRFGPGRLADIENAAQDAQVRALERWTVEGVPVSPEGWLVKVAHNALVDALRRERPLASVDEIAVTVAPPALELDDELRLLFLCCHPALPRAAQVALMLNVACGLGARQIARAFLSDERAMAQRLVRAKARLREEGPRFELPEERELPARLEQLLDALYLSFGDGYHPIEGEDPMDAAVCGEALRLVRLLSGGGPTAQPSTFALRALMSFHLARAPARIADDGSLLTLPEQDRSRWDGALLAEGLAALARAGAGEELTRFHLEAGIAACHALAPTYAATDWPQVLELYDLLRACAPSLVVDVNRAIALAMVRGARAGIDELDAIPERELVARYPYALAAYADLHASLGENDSARSYLDLALAQQSAPAQQALLRRKRAALPVDDPKA
jgi:RNA polymerase sigma-70 factor (ECF subfamily)